MKYKLRRLIAIILTLIGVGTWVIINPASYETTEVVTDSEEGSIFEETEQNPNNGGAVQNSDNRGDEAASLQEVTNQAPLASVILEQLEVKGRAPKTGYARTEFYSSWPTVDGCNLRQRIIKREFGETAVLDGCNVLAGEYDEPYTGEHKVFTTREQISKGVQIDHVVALSDAWQKGAQYLSVETRYEIATDPLNLLAVDSAANEKKSDGDAATWLPPSKKFRCQYVARQVSVKYKYDLWVTEAEKAAIAKVLTACPNEPAVGLE